MEPDQLREVQDELIARLAELAADAEVADAEQALALEWKGQLEAAATRAEAPLSVAFLAEVGCGKSTLIAAATGLRLTDVSIAEKPTLWSVLPVGLGRTTLGEIRVECVEREGMRVEVEPVPEGELKLELEFLTQDLFDEVADTAKGTNSTKGEELYELLRTWLVPDAEEPREALRALARQAKDIDQLRRSLLGRVDLAQRSEPYQRDFDADEAGRRALKDCLAKLMSGELPQAPAPSRTTVRLPDAPLGTTIGCVIDTQGLEPSSPAGLIRARPDLQELLQDRDTLLVVASRFEAAPDGTSIALIHEIYETLGPDGLSGRALRLLIVDREDPPKTTTERRAIERQRTTKLEQCQDKIRRDDDLQDFASEWVHVINARSDTDALRAVMIRMAEQARQERLDAWQETQEQARQALSTLRQAEFPARAREIELRLFWAWDAACASASRPNITGLGAVGWAIGNQYAIDHWSHVNAAMRRRGRYRRLNLAALGASTSAMFETHPLYRGLRAVHDVAGTLESRESDPAIVAHIALRRRQFRRAVTEHREQFVNAWRRELDAYFASSTSDDIWRYGVGRWGAGSGYLRDIANCFKGARRKAGLRVSIPGSLRALEGKLPPRPPLLRLRRVQFENFRGIEGRDLHIGGLTVLSGDNGLGKTGWLEGIAAALGALLPGLGAGDAPPLVEGDVRQVIQEIGGVPDRQHQLPMEITVDATLVGRTLRWSRRVEAIPIEETISDDEAVRVRARLLGDAVRAHEPVQLPVLAYYGTQRLWPPELEAETARREVGNRLDGYRDCLKPASTHKHALDWMRHFTFAELQDKTSIPQLRAVERAVVSCVRGAKHFRYDVKHEELRLFMKSGEILPFRFLSDGYRNIVAMVADIAWRASVLNPQLGEQAPALAEGVVLIDEIDLHLHPNWQRRVLADLRRAFPRLQFVTTTHSPFIIQSLEAGQLVNLDPDATDAPYADESPEDIAEHVMGVEVPQRSQRRQEEVEVAERYYALLERVPEADEGELHRLRARLDELIAPYADNQAFVALLQRKRLVAEAQRA